MGGFLIWGFYIMCDVFLGSSTGCSNATVAKAEAVFRLLLGVIFGVSLIWAMILFCSWRVGVLQGWISLLWQPGLMPLTGLSCCTIFWGESSKRLSSKQADKSSNLQCRMHLKRGRTHHGGQSSDVCVPVLLQVW